MSKRRRKYKNADPRLSPEQSLVEGLFGRRVVRVLGGPGRSGMGVVYAMKEPESSRLYALKLIPIERWRNLEFVKRFHNEAKNWLTIPPHPNITQAHHYCRFRGIPFLLLEYVPGGDLHEYAALGKFDRTAENIIGLALQICDAMIHIAQHGLELHGDIKPQNCLLSVDGRTLKLTDFGLSKALSANDSQLVAASSWNSVSFAAPERLRGNEYGATADIFSLGALISWMFEGQAPLRSFDAQVGELPIQNPRLRGQDRVYMEEILSKCCAASPSARYPNFKCLRQVFARAYEHIIGTPAPALVSSEGWQSCQCPDLAGNLLALKDFKRALNICELGLQDPFAREIPALERWLLKLKSLALGGLRNYSGAIETCDILLNRDDIEPDTVAEIQSIRDSLSLARKGKGYVISGISGFEPSPQRAKYQACLYAGHKSVSLGQPRDALVHYLQAWDLCPVDDDELSVGLGTAAVGLGELDRARESFRTAIQVNPHNPAAYYNLAILFAPEGEFEAADSNLEHACLIDDAFSEAWAARGRLQLQVRGDKEKARMFFLRALELDPQNEALAEEFANKFGEVDHGQN